MLPELITIRQIENDITTYNWRSTKDM